MRDMNSQTPSSDYLRRSRLRILIAVIAAFVLGGLLIPNLHIRWGEPNSRAESGPGLGVTPGPPPGGLGEGEAYARAAQIASPAVVNIDTQQRVNAGFMDDDWFSNAPRVRTTEGSGVII